MPLYGNTDIMEGLAMKRMLCLTVLCLAAGWAAGEMDKNNISVAGEWRFRMDPDNKGLTEGWPADGISGDTVTLPGSMDENGKGIPNEKRHVEYLSRLYEYVGAAWYERDVTIPPEWAGKRITLNLERVHWESRVWVDGKFLGTQDSLCTPHVHDLSVSLKPGNHRITLCIDNRVKFYVGMNAHSITEHTQTNWNGAIGKMTLKATDPVYIDDVQAYPNLADRTVKVKVRVANAAEQDAVGELAVRGGNFEPRGNDSDKKAQTGNDRKRAAQTKVPLSVAKGETSVVEFALTLPSDARVWGENAPDAGEDSGLQPLEINLSAKAGSRNMTGTGGTVFAFRDIGRNGTQLTLNGKPYFVRGNLECCIFPLTAHPPMDVKSWQELLLTEKSYGVNHIRFHSWCPPEAAFLAADIVGMTFHIETPVWTELGTHADTDEYIRAESMRILDTYGNHPSFCFLATGNEPSGKNMNAFLTDIIARWKAKDPRHLYTTCAGWPELDVSDYHVLPERKRMPLRLHNNKQYWGPSTDFDYSAALEGCSAPVIAHELAQWCVYPRYDEIDKYTGVLRAWNLETFKGQLAKNGMAWKDTAFAKASGRLQWLMYKADMEAVLRTPGMAGYQLLSVQDFPGQGSALVGVADALWGNKGAVPPEEFKRVNGATVPLLRFEKYVWRSSETFHAKGQIAHFGDAPLKDKRVTWTVGDAAGKVVASGAWSPAEIPLGNATMLGELDVPLSGVTAPARLTVTLGVEGTDFQNTWDLWVYPGEAPKTEARDVLITDAFDKKAEKALEKGGSVLLVPEYVAPAQSVLSAFEPVFWDMQWFAGQRRQLGVLCDPKDPALAQFPNDGYTNWQWWELLNKSRVMNLSTLPEGMEPIVRVIDDWNTNRPLGALFELRAGKGRLMVCTLDIEKDLDNRPAAAALRRSLLAYMAGEQFNPKTEVSVNTLRDLFVKKDSDIASVEADSEERGYPAKNAVDGDPKTIWHTPFQGKVPTFPHELRIQFSGSIDLAGLRYTPRQDVANGFIGDYEVYAGKDGKDWGRAVAGGTFKPGAAAQEIRFDKPVRAKWLRFVAKSGQGNDAFAAVAEIEPIKK